jgi:hypothetical protein
MDEKEIKLRMKRSWKIPSSIIPKQLYHLTPWKHIDSIKKTGINVSSKRTTESGVIRGVYLTNDPNDVVHGGDFPRYGVAILKVKTTGLTLYFDQEFYLDYNEEKELMSAIKKNEAPFMCFSKNSIPNKNILNIEDFYTKKKTPQG